MKKYKYLRIDIVRHSPIQAPTKPPTETASVISINNDMIAYNNTHTLEQNQCIKNHLQMAAEPRIKFRKGNLIHDKSNKNFKLIINTTFFLPIFIFSCFGTLK